MKRLAAVFVLIFACVSMLTAITPVWATGPGGFKRADAQSPAPITPSQRGAAARQFVLKWGAYVQQTYGVSVRTWALRLAPQFAGADPINVRAALERETFEGAMAALDGVGHRLSDDRVINTLARLPDGVTIDKSRLVAKALGDTTQDLVYNPITPCRIVDTRNMPAGAIPASESRNFIGAGLSNYGAQGGSATDCGLHLQAPSALALNVTAVFPNGAGYATVYPYNVTRPETASVNYAAGDIVNNAIITAIPTPVGNFDFTIYTFAQAHYVVDIVGYFDNPRSSPVNCVNGPFTDLTIAAGATGVVSANGACPAGYGSASVNCDMASWDMPLAYISGNSCAARNNGASPALLRAGWRCCRIPGR